MTSVLRRAALFLPCFAVLSLHASNAVYGQEVVVFPPEDSRRISGSTDRSWVEKIGRNQNILVVPVVTLDDVFDPARNEVAGLPGMTTFTDQLRDRFQQAGSFWEEVSYGQLSFTPRVLSRYYQIPLRSDDLYYPSFESVSYSGRNAFYPGGTITLPPGRMRIEYTSSLEGDTAVIPVDFGGGAREFSQMQLRDRFQNALDAVLGAGRVEVSTGGGTSDGVPVGRLDFAVPDEFVSEGTALRFVGDSPEDWNLIDSIGLDTGRMIGLPGSTTWLFASAITTFPFMAATFPPAPATFQLRVRLVDDSLQTLRWDIADATRFETIGDWIAFVNAGPSEITGLPGAPIVEVTARDAGDRRFALSIASLVAGTGIRSVEDLLFGLRGTEVQDALGVYEFGQDGVTTLARQRALRYSGQDLVGQALAALMINELGRADNLLDLPSRPTIAAGSEADLSRLFRSVIDPFEAFAVVLINNRNLRDVASYGYPKIGIRSGGYTFEHVTAGSYQVNLGDTTGTVIAHEIGHKFGLPDLYDNSGGRYDARLLFPDVWDVMHNHVGLAHADVFSKHFFEGARSAAAPSWLPTTAVIEGPAAPETGTDPVSEAFLITPIEHPVATYDEAIGTISDGRLTFDGVPVVKAVSLPLGRRPGEGRELEHRIQLQNRQPGIVFSANLPQLAGAAAPGGLYLTDSISEGLFDFLGAARGGRNLVHPLADTVVDDVAQPILDTGAVNDVNLAAAYPPYPAIRVDVQRAVDGPAGFADAKSLLVNVTRNPIGDHVDLHIEPWGAPPYESADIWIEHGDSPLTNTTPLRDNGGNGQTSRYAAGYGRLTLPPLNWTRVRVRNFGSVDAENVRVQMQSNTPGGIGDRGDWIELISDDDTKRIPSGGEAIFNFAWNPETQGHTCLRASIISFDAGATSPAADIDLTNNAAQENVTVVEMVGRSPYRPRQLAFDVQNPLDHAIDVELTPVGVFDGLDVELRPSFVRVPPNGKREVQMMLGLDEGVVPTPDPLPDGSLRLNAFAEREVHVVGSLLGGDTTIPIGGMTYLIRPTHDLELVTTIRPDPIGSGFTVEGRTVPPARFRPIEVMIRAGRTEIGWLTLMTDSSGLFHTRAWSPPGRSLTVAVRHPGSEGYASAAIEPQLIRSAPGIDLSQYLRPWIHVVVPSTLATEGRLISGLFTSRTGAATSNTVLAEAEAVAAFCTASGAKTGDVLYLPRRLDREERGICKKNGAGDLIELQLAKASKKEQKLPLFAYVKKRHLALVRGLTDYIDVLVTAPELQRDERLLKSISILPADERTNLNEDVLRQMDVRIEGS